jgi:DNA-binding CsgD family transcriptional regulator
MEYKLKSLKYMSEQDCKLLLDIIQTCLICESKEKLEEIIHRLDAFFYFDYATCVFGGIDAKGMKEPYHHLNINYPDEWSKLYAEKKFHFIDPIFIKHFEKFSLQYWANTYAKSPKPKEFIDLSLDFQLMNGYTFGAKNAKGTKGSLVSFSGPSMCRDKRTEIIISILVPHIHQSIERLINEQKKRQFPSLTKREHEVLKWLVCGKTAWEISIILSISERTVRLYISTLLQKLDAVSSTHAAAIGLDAGLVELD